MARRKTRKQPDGSMNMTPMIDVVFQMIIFFITTSDLDRKAFDEKIRLAMSPHGPAVEKRDPRTITIEVDQNGRIKLGPSWVSYGALKGMMQQAVANYGQSVPVVIRGDQVAQHGEIRRVMDICSVSGLWKLKFAATKEEAEDAQ